MTPEDRKRFFDRHAGDWDETSYTHEQLQRIGGLLLGLGLRTGWSVLDVGTGTGVIVPGLLDAVGRSGSVTGVDMSGAMLEKARAKGFPDNVHFVEGRIEDLPLPDGAFDAAVCFSAFPHFEDHPRALGEIRRVLKPGGSAHILHLEGSERINEVHQECGGAVRHDVLPGEDDMRALLESCGFEVLSFEDRPDRYSVEARK